MMAVMMMMLGAATSRASYPTHVIVSVALRIVHLSHPTPPLPIMAGLMAGLMLLLLLHRQSLLLDLPFVHLVLLTPPGHDTPAQRIPMPPLLVLLRVYLPQQQGSVHHLPPLPRRLLRRQLMTMTTIMILLDILMTMQTERRNSPSLLERLHSACF